MRRQLINVEDYRRAAQRRLPGMIFDFIEGGAEDEYTLAENRRAFQDLALRPAVLAGLEGKPETAVEVVGQRLSLPVMVGPTGTSRIAGPEGEIGAARGAAAAGTAAVISNGTTIPLDRIVAEAPEPPWLQIKFFRDREWTAALLERAAGLGVPAIVALVDAPAFGNRERDARHRLTLPARPRLRWMPSIARRPRWLLETLTSPPIDAAGLPEIGTHLPLRDALDRGFNPAADWAYLEWIRERWKGQLLVKGVMRAEDAERAVAAGCEGVIVSNHGGRQLDSVPSALDMLPAVVEAIGSNADVLLDGGIRRGTDVIKAVALGAKACLIGRPWLWGLRVGGSQGVADVIEVLRSELELSMTLLGARSLAELGPEVLLRRPGSGWERLDEGGDSPQLGGG